MEAFGLSSEGLTTLDQMKTRLSERLKHLEGSSTRRVGEVSTHSPSFFLVTNTDCVKQMIVKVLCECIEVLTVF